MRKTLLFLAMALATWVATPAAFAQNGPGQVLTGNTTPPPLCTAAYPLYVNLTTGISYSCTNGSYVRIGGGAPGGAAGGDLSGTYPNPAVSQIHGALTGPLSITGNLQATNVIPDGTPVIDVRALGAICNGMHDDTTSIATAATLAGTNSGILLIPNTGAACETSAAVQLPANAWLEIDGDLQATAAMSAVVVAGDSTHIFANRAIYGHGSVDPNAMALRGIWIRQGLTSSVQDLHIGPGTAATAGIEICDTSIGSPQCADVTTFNTTEYLPSGTNKVGGSIGIFQTWSDGVILDNTIIGYDIGAEDTAGSNHWISNHVWGFLANSPSTCYLHTGSASTWIDDVADTCNTTAFHFEGFADVAIGGQIVSNPTDSTTSSFNGVVFDQANPFSSIFAMYFDGGSSGDVMANAISGASSNLELAGNLDGTNVTNYNAYDTFYNAFIASGSGGSIGNWTSSGLAATTNPIRDETVATLKANMSAADGTVAIGSTGAGNAAFSWPVTAANWYNLRCTLPVTYAATATIRFQLYSVSGSVTISNVSAETFGNTGAAGVFQNLITIAGTSLAGSETPATGAPGASETITYDAQFLSSHAGNIGIEFIGNGANNLTMLLGGECTATQTN